MPDKNVIKGQLKRAEGQIQKAVGDLTDNPKLKAKGTVNKLSGSVQESVGHLKDAARSANKP